MGERGDLLGFELAGVDPPLEDDDLALVRDAGGGDGCDAVDLPRNVLAGLNVVLRIELKADVFRIPVLELKDAFDSGMAFSEGSVKDVKDRDVGSRAPSAVVVTKLALALLRGAEVVMQAVVGLLHVLGNPICLHHSGVA